MQRSRWFQFFLRFPILPASLPKVFGNLSKLTNYNWYHLHFQFFSSRARSWYSPLFSLSFIWLCCWPGQQSPLFGRFFFFFSFFVDNYVWSRLGDPFISQNPRELCVSLSPRRILGYEYITCSYSQISIFCTIPSESPSPPSRV